MGTNFYRIPSVKDMEVKKNLLLTRIRQINVTAESIFKRFSIDKNSNTLEYVTPWDEFIDGVGSFYGTFTIKNITQIKKNCLILSNLVVSLMNMVKKLILMNLLKWHLIGVKMMVGTLKLIMKRIRPVKFHG